MSLRALLAHLARSGRAARDLPQVQVAVVERATQAKNTRSRRWDSMTKS
jgi:hypothetical protein